MNLAEAILWRPRRAKGGRHDTTPCFRTMRNDGAQNTTLSYGSAQAALREHQVWLQERILESTTTTGGGGGGTSGEDTRTFDTADGNFVEDCTDTTNDRDTVMAYLAWNAVDYFLSVLACTALPADAATTTTTSQHATVVLLNTRWTAMEMASALQPTSNGSKRKSSINDNHNHGNVRRTTAHTILLYSSGGSDGSSDGLESIAHQVAQLLTTKNNDSNHHHHHHRVQCIALPTFALRRMSATPPPPPSQQPPTSTIVRCATNHHSSNHAPIVSSFHHASPVQTIRPMAAAAAAAAAASEEDALIVFTSGTTNTNHTSGGSGSTAKGVRLSHRAILVQAYAKLQPPCSYTSHTQVHCTTLPFCHVGGLTSLLAVWLAGGTLVTTATTTSPPPQFDPVAIWASIQTQTVNTLIVVPAMLYALQETYHQNTPHLNHGNTANSTGEPNSTTDTTATTAYPGVALVLIGGQSADAALRKFVRTVFPQARVVQTYACTEAASSLTFSDVTTSTTTLSSNPASAAVRTYTNNNNNNKKVALRSRSDETVEAAVTVVGDCVGRPPPHVELVILQLLEQPPPGSTRSSSSSRSGSSHPEEHAVVVSEPFTTGIIATRGPHVMNGYWVRGSSGRAQNSPPSARNGSTLSSSLPWMRTNDLGYWDEQGRLYFCGRRTDSIRTGGETVMATEVERVLEQHPAVRECAVFGLRDDQFGEVVSCAIVVVTEREPQQQPQNILDRHNIRHWCEQCGLAGYKRPRRVFFVEDLPRNSSGKILKFRLVEIFGQKSQQQKAREVMMIPSKL